ncbi:hypothetical protein BD626DRAFT_533689 [Schizophyllum amplum]|uniref:F-box domain-containing protein n=1 Tax=Schizophyllum amplum TaxID=97359 RepID=A0A550D055_9AGAR|nr:hypothetical protein BD626DRAFT_533689 [Auriculariopsis ampla]
MGLFSSVYSSAATEHVRHDIDIALVPATRTSSTTPATTPTRRVDIPLELVYDILEHAALTPATEPDRATLRASALVCSSWLVPAQRLLFRHVALRDASAADTFRVTMERQPALAAAVRSLRATVDRNQPDGLSELTFAHVVKCCPRLETVHLALFGPAADVATNADRNTTDSVGLDVDTLALLAAGPRISALHLANWSADATVLFDLLAAWSNCVRALSLAGVPPVLPLTTTQPCAMPIEALRVNCTGPLNPECADWLLRDARLRALDVARVWDDEALRMLEAQGSALEALALPALQEPALVDAVRDGCPRLRTLTVAGAWIAPAVWRAEACSLEHLAMGLAHSTNLHGVVRAVHNGALRSVTLRSSPDGIRHPQLVPLKMACAMSGVDFLITSDVREFKMVTAHEFSASAGTDMFTQIAAS